MLATHVRFEPRSEITVIEVSVAWNLVYTDLEAFAKFVPMTITDFRTTIERMAMLGLSGGTVYDALVATVAQRLSVDKLLTLNLDDFLRVCQRGKRVILSP